MSGPIVVTAENAVEKAKAVRAGELPGPAKTLAEAIVRVMERVEYVQKKGTVTVGQGYKYASEAEFIAKLRPELVVQGIVMCPVDMQPLFNEQVQTKSGSQNRIVLRVTWRLTHAASGQTLDVVTCGEGQDAGDKATNKAMTGAMKYALRQAFVIETGNDPDDTPSQDQQRVAQRQDEPPPAKPAAPERPVGSGIPAADFARLTNDFATAKTAADLTRIADAVRGGLWDRATGQQRNVIRQMTDETRGRLNLTPAGAK